MGEITDALKHAREASESSTVEHDPPSERNAPATRDSHLRNPPDTSFPRGGPIISDDFDINTVEIPRSMTNPWHGRAVVVEEQRWVAERYRQLAHRVRTELLRDEKRITIVTSAVSGEGVTTTVCNLALALGSIASDHRVALVDLDLHRPSVARELGIDFAVGFDAVLSSGAALGSVCLRTNLPALDVYPSKRRSGPVHELLASQKLPAALNTLARNYDIVLIDTPPVLPLPDVALIAAHANACIGIARAGFTSRSSFQEMLTHLPEGQLIGCFLNATGRNSNADYYDRYEPEPEPRADENERKMWRKKKKN